MTALPGFSDNKFECRYDVERACIALLSGLCKYQSSGNARIKLPVSTGAHFDECAAQLEGFARPLWAVAALLMCSDSKSHTIRDLGTSFADGLRNGTDPVHPEYWGSVTTSDQRMVEMEIISFALLSAPDIFYHNQDPKAKVNIRDWLMSINGKPMPPTNWRWFRVFTNLALYRVCDVQGLEKAIKADMELLETFYISDGWSSDGLWSDDGRQADYYSGSFAIQFSQLMYIKFASDLDPVRCQRFRDRAFLYSRDFHYYFGSNGAAIPFGRSLTYRFAFAGFWAAAAFVGVGLSPPVAELGEIKHLLLQHLRWWSLQTDIFNADGTLNIGFTYPNMFMCEDYNSPQSVYWCMKTFCCLGLSESHPFWTAVEAKASARSRSLSHLVKPAMQIISDSGDHHFLLSSGQYCPWPLKATESKYSKFAYSSHFGFSVPTGPLIQQMAPDSTLALQIHGDDVWKVRWVPLQPRSIFVTVIAGSSRESIPALLSSWKPWKLLDVDVETVLIPACSRWKDWHIRVHRIRVGASMKDLLIDVLEGGFATFARKSLNGLPLDQFAEDNPEIITKEGVITTRQGCLVLSPGGVSGICQAVVASEDTASLQLEGLMMKPDSNTNLMHNRTVIPCLTGILGPVRSLKTYCLVTAVFATREWSSDIMTRWRDVPVVSFRKSDDSTDARIQLDL